MGFGQKRVAAVLGLCLSSACAGPAAVGDGARAPPTPAAKPGVRAAASDGPAAVLGRFLDALQAGRWEEADALLSARWRAAYTPERLSADYAGSGPVGREAVLRAADRLATGAALEARDGRAVLPVLGGEAVLVAEPGGWRVDALE
jgi:hypothetical protein